MQRTSDIDNHHIHVHLAEAIETLVLRNRPARSEDRLPKDPYSAREASGRR